MVGFLTDEWIAALDDAASAQRSPLDETFVIEYRVERESGDAFVYQIRFGTDAITVTTGGSSTPTIVLTTDRATALGVATNTLSAQAAFMAGQLRLDGDTMALVRNHEALAQLDAIFAGVRTTTEF